MSICKTFVKKHHQNSFFDSFTSHCSRSLGYLSFPSFYVDYFIDEIYKKLKDKLQGHYKRASKFVSKE